MNNKVKQLRLFPEVAEDTKSSFKDPAFMGNKVLPIHRWVPWIAGFSQSFVSSVLEKYMPTQKGVVLDSFAGVGTTLVEAYQEENDVIGFEINPYPFLAMTTKLNVGLISPQNLYASIREFKEYYDNAVATNKLPQSDEPIGFRTRIPFYSEAVLAKVLHVIDFIATLSDEKVKDIFRIAFASTMVSYSNYSYEPSLSTRASSGKNNIDDYGVGEAILSKLHQIYEDVVWFQAKYSLEKLGNRKLINHTFFEADQYIESNSVDLLITSPPYLNNYHYNRNTRPHLYWLGYAESPSDLKPLEQANFGTYWQTVRDLEHVNFVFELSDSDLTDRIALLREINPEKGVYGGNGWANYATQYFNDCYRFSEMTCKLLKPGGYATIVIGNSILQGIMIPTDRYLAEIAEKTGLEVVNIEIPRSTRVGNSIIQSEVRVGKAKKKDQLYEAVVTLRKS